jgi:hypothetical protein
MLASVLAAVMAPPCFAGTAQKWEELPKPVQDAIFAHGRVAGPVDKESEVKDGKAIYESSIKDKDGNTRDLVITDEDGKLVEIKFRSEDVSNTIGEIDEVVSISETVTVPAGTYKDCVRIKESLADGTTEYKLYAKGVGVVREVPSDGDELLVSHETALAK